MELSKQISSKFFTPMSVQCDLGGALAKAEPCILADSSWSIGDLDLALQETKPVFVRLTTPVSLIHRTEKQAPIG